MHKLRWLHVTIALIDDLLILNGRLAQLLHELVPEGFPEEVPFLVLVDLLALINQGLVAYKNILFVRVALDRQLAVRNIRHHLQALLCIIRTLLRLRI